MSSTPIPTSTLLKAISDSDDTIMFSEVVAFPVTGATVLIGTEQINYSANVSGTLYGCTRGANSTTPAAHSIGAVITLVNLYAASSATPSDVTVVPAAPVNSRLTTESGVAVSRGDRTAQGTIYYTAGSIQLYSGSEWVGYNFSQLSLALTVTSGSNYDVFVVLSAGVPSLVLGTAWTNDTTRAIALTLQDGAYVLSTDTTKRYVGTIRASGSNVTEDSGTKRYVWNAYNQAVRPLVKNISTSSWSYSSSTIRQVNADTANQVAVVVGLQGPTVALNVNSLTRSADSIGETALCALGFDSTTTVADNCFFSSNAAQSNTAYLFTNVGRFQDTPTLGYHFFPALEAVSNNQPWDFFGSDGGLSRTIGIIGSVQA